MHIKTPRLFRNRCGVFYFRLKTATADRRVSLRTKCPQTAAIIALQLNSNIERTRAMSNPKLSDFNFDSEALRQYEIDLKNGVFKADGKEDSDLMASFLGKMGIDIAAIEATMKVANPALPPSPAPAPLAPPAAPAKSAPLPEAIDKWLEQSGAKNETRTVDSKEYHIKDFLRRRFGHVKAIAHWLSINQNTPNMQKKALLAVDAASYQQQTITANAVDKAVLVSYKSELLKESQKAKTIDNKLMTLHNFLKYAIAHRTTRCVCEKKMARDFDYI